MLAVALLVAATGTEALDAMVKAAIVCPPPVRGEITVCGRRDAPGERSRYRSPVPSEYEVGDPRARSVAHERYDLLDFGDMGGKICSTVGPGGAFGCRYEKHMAWAAQKAGARDPRGPLYDK